MIISISTRPTAWLGIAAALFGAAACSGSHVDSNANGSSTDSGGAAPDAGAAVVPDNAPSGVCSEVQFVPSTACFGYDCDSNSASWLCDAGAGDPQADGGTACGATPPDYDGCLQWSCAPGTGWQGKWLCNDCRLDSCWADGGAAACAYMNSSDVGRCYCDPPGAMPDTGGWVCPPARQGDD